MAAGSQRRFSMPTDPVLLEIAKNALLTAAQEMGIAVVLSAFSTRIKERSDATAAIFDAKGRLLAQSGAAPLSHLASLRPSLTELLVDFPIDAMADGDLFAMNDPYRGGIHANDIMVYRPVFLDGAPAFFTAALVHVADVGGIAAGGLPANATDVFQEGLLLPPVRIGQASGFNDAILDILKANSRTPDKVIGDIRAMIAATHVGSRRLRDLADRYGAERLIALAAELLDYSERRTRLEIEAIPPGEYRGEYWIDDDGVEPGRPYRVQVTVQVGGSDLSLDFTGTDAQAKGPINASYSQAMSGAVLAVRAFLDPTIPMNEGCFKPLRLLLPEGTLVNPRMPAACNARIVTNMAVAEAVARALSQAFPDRAVAASSINLVYTLSGGGNGDKPMWMYLENDFGGTGARAFADGVDGAGFLVLGGSGGATPVEALEQDYPVLFQRYGLWRDSGGPGRFRGGLGLERTFRVLEPAKITVRTDRVANPPTGVLGGAGGVGGQWVINGDDGREIVLPSKATGVDLRPGDTFTIRGSGGGGAGEPFERDSALVLQDVREGLVSVGKARELYGVVVDGAAVDQAATLALRGRGSGSGA